LVASEIQALKDFMAGSGEHIDQLFGAMLEALPVAIYMTDAEGRLKYFNTAAAKLSGRNPELGTDQWCVTWKLFRPDGTPLPHDQCPMAIALKGGEVLSGIECIAERPNGTRFWFTPHPVILRDAEGRIIGGINLLVDITDRKNAEIEAIDRLRLLQASERHLEDAQRLAKVGSWERQVAADQDQCSDEMLRILGWNEGPLTFSAFLNLVHPSYRESVAEAASRTLTGLGPFDIEYLITRPDGEVRFVRSIGEGIPDEHGGMARIIGATQDITEEVAARELLRISEGRLKNAERLAHVGHWQWELETNVVSWSDETFRIFEKPDDYTPSYEGLLEMTLPEDIARVDGWVRDCIAEKRGSSLEFRIARSDGDVRTIATVSEVVLGEGGVPVRLFGACHDITARKQIEEKLRKSEEELRALAGRLLTAKEDEQRRLSRELHDDVTQQLAFLSVELGKLAMRIPDSAPRVRVLQDQTLQIATEVRRQSHGLHPSTIEELGLNIALEEFCRDFSASRGIPVTFDRLMDDSQLDQLDIANAICLYRVAQESLRNAVVHGRATEIHVGLSVSAGSFQLRIRDNGTGFFPDKARAKTGLGLVSMRERVRFAHGKLTISSAPGRGAEIAASIPLTATVQQEGCTTG
jgi:PAS domain S-box-containing protein